jgi:1,4-dihydroxy-2-naphthoyl-CoA hydrolase
MAADEIAERERRPHFAGLLRIEWLADEPDGAKARVAVRDELLQPFGILDGGVMSTVIEDLCSRTTALAVLGEGNVAMGQSISVNFLRPITEGHAEVTARARHRGRTTWVWHAEVRDSADRLCAIGQMTIAVRPVPTGA